MPRNPALLRQHGITHVLSLTDAGRGAPEIPAELGIEHESVAIGDNPLEDLLQCLEGLCAWIGHALGHHHHHDQASPPNNLLAAQGGSGGGDGGQLPAETDTEIGIGTGDREPRVLVHCAQGISRSGAVVTAYVMRALGGLDYEAALSRVRARRAVVAPNPGFADQLRLWRELGYCVFTTTEAGAGKAAVIKMKPRYEAWKSGRGVLLSRAEQERQMVLVERMRRIAAMYPLPAVGGGEGKLVG